MATRSAFHPIPRHLAERNGQRSRTSSRSTGSPGSSPGQDTPSHLTRRSDSSSGHAKNALLGSSELSSQIAEANDPRHPRKVIICPASGINATNVGRLRELVPQMEEVHLSSSSAVRGGGREAVLKGVEMGFGADEVWRMDVGRFEDFWRVVKRWNQKG